MLSIMDESIPFRQASNDTMPHIMTSERQPPARVCERMIKLLKDVLTNCRSVVLRDELATLQHSLHPAARELDKWVSIYKTYGTRSGQDIHGLAKLHNEILTGDQEIAAYLIKSANEYVDWCTDELHTCVKQPLTTERVLQEGFLKEDLRSLSKTYDQLRDMLASNLKHKRWMNPNQPPKRKHEASSSNTSQLHAVPRNAPYPPISRNTEVIELDDSGDSPNPVQVASASMLSAGPIDQDIRPRKRTKRDRVLPVDPELASHAASSILRAIGRHPDLPALNAGLEDVLPQKLRRHDIPKGESLATVQHSMVKMAELWWVEKE